MDISSCAVSDENARPTSEAALAAAAPAQWRAAKSLLKLRSQVNQLAPERSIASDGIVADTHHPGTSDHQPRDIDGQAQVVTAIDITHDPVHNCDAQSIVNALVASRDSRIKYIIYNGKIINSSVSPWTWRDYDGANPHTRHFHLSCVAEVAKFDSEANWSIT